LHKINLDIKNEVILMIVFSKIVFLNKIKLLNLIIMIIMIIIKFIKIIKFRILILNGKDIATHLLKINSKTKSPDLPR